MKTLIKILKFRSTLTIFLLSFCFFILLINFMEINSLLKPCNQAIEVTQKQDNNTTHKVFYTTSQTTSTTTSTTQFLQFSKTNKIKFKNLLDILGNTQSNVNYDPDFEITKNRVASLVIGISTVKRDYIYLYDTLNSIFSAINYDKQYANELLLVISIPEFEDKAFVNETVTKLLSLYRKELDNGLIDIIQPSKKFYSKFNETIKTDHIFNDPRERIKWRKKQNYDVSYLMNYAKDRGTYYLHLEDDILCQYNFISEIIKFVNKTNYENEIRWSMIEFSELGFIGKLFRTTDLPMYINIFLMFSDYKPIDLLHNYIFDIMACDPSKSFIKCKPNFVKVKVTFKPSLFQHVGLKSSLKGKIQKIKDRKFVEKIPIVKHVNPQATIATSFKFYQGHNFAKLYFGTDYSWANEGTGNDHITINFSEKFKLKSYIIKSGTSMHPDDKLPLNTTLEIKPSDLIEKSFIEKKNLTLTYDNYIVIDKITDNSGNMVNELDNALIFNIESLRLNVSGYTGEKWILIYEFGVF